jgi:hypothetical protein
MDESNSKLLLESTRVVLQAVTEWFDLTRALAVAGTCISLVSLYFTWQNRKLALAQEKRRLPRLAPTLVNGYFQDGTDAGRVYAFLVTIVNPTDTNNAVAEAELSITYLTTDRVQMTMKLLPTKPAKTFVKGYNDTLVVPLAVPAHNAVSGILHFQLPKEMLVGRTIDSYQLALTDAQGEVESVVPILVQEYRDEV